MFKRMIDCVEMHEGEPLRVVLSGIPSIPGDTIYEQILWLRDHEDAFRKLVVNEPRGTDPVCCCVIVPAKDPRADVGCFIMSRTGFLTVSGATIIAGAVALVQTGLIPMREPVTKFTMETGAGLLSMEVECRNGKAKKASWCGPSCFAPIIDQEIDVPHIGKVTVSMAWGCSCWYVCTDAVQLNLPLDADHAKEIVRKSALITQAAKDQLSFKHPDFPRENAVLSIMYEPSENPGTYMRTANVYNIDEIDYDNPDTWTGSMDRGVCGTGTCALVALEHARGNMELGKEYVNEGILGIQFTCSAVEKSRVGEWDAVVPKIGGPSWIYGFTKWVLEDDDPFPEGFTLNV